MQVGSRVILEREAVLILVVDKELVVCRWMEEVSAVGEMERLTRKQ